MLTGARIVAEGNNMELFDKMLFLSLYTCISSTFASFVWALVNKSESITISKTLPPACTAWLLVDI